MHTASFVADVARTQYGFEPQSIESLDQYSFDWRGIYRVHDAQGDRWVMRLKQDLEAVDALTHTARLLEWLGDQLYPAPVVRATKDQQLVGKIDDWAISMLSYVEGSVLTRLMMGTAGLALVRANRVLPLVQEHPEAAIWHTLVNAVSAAYGTGGFPCLPVVPLPVDLVMTAHVSPVSGRATGVIKGFDALCELIEKRLGSFEAIAIFDERQAEPLAA